MCDRGMTVEDFKAEVRRRFDQTFGIERLNLFSDDIQKLENDGDSNTATALRDLLKEQDDASQKTDVRYDNGKPS